MGSKRKQNTQNRQFKRIYLTLFIYFVIIFIVLSFNGGFILNFSIGLLLFLIFVGITIFFLFFFSQFVLPVLNVEKRFKAAQRIFLYIFGDHGPAIFIENGELRERRIDRLKNGPGVIILDTASAAVLRTPVRYIGAIGPGIAFTERNDFIAGVVDLHIQSQSVGPRQEEDPFSPVQKGESNAAFEARISRRNESMAITRDGIQICVNLTVRFKMDSSPGEGNSAFGFNPTAVERAIIGQSINFVKPDDNPERIVSWKWLPLNLVLDIYREYISKYTINELFPLSRMDTNLVSLISEQIKQRLTQSQYRRIDNYGNQSDETILSKEFELLKKRGIRFLDIVITNLRFPQSIEEELQNRWRTSWLDIANREKKIVEQEQVIQSIAGQNQALMDYAYGTTKHLGSETDFKELDSREILVSLLKGNLDTISQDPDLSSYLINEYKDISDLIDWIRSQGDIS
ncbi:MAG: hypothetical protein Q7U53_05695 [Anaerolineaceae bacterium]|nr:hypothetical protein [Anaerolineaceae bacterium]